MELSKKKPRELSIKDAKAKFANTTTPLTRPLDDGPIGGQVSGVSLYKQFFYLNYFLFFIA